MEATLISAINFARRAHAGQVRKYTNEPYITHPFAVAGLVASVTQDNDMLIAALLHDVVEDSEATIEQIYEVFGFQVAALVHALTDVSQLKDGPRAERKAIDRAHTAAADARAKTIKLADLIDNSKSILTAGSGFARIYMQEKRLLLGVLKEGDPRLYRVADRIVSDYFSANPQAQ